MTRAAASSRAGAFAPMQAARGYFQKSELPWTSLIFILPWLVIYEVGKLHVSTDVTAFAWMQEFFHFFGVSARHLPAMAVVGILLSWHIARRDEWTIEPKYLLLMVVESAILAGPLLLMALAAARYFPLMGLSGATIGRLVLSFGAGIYEELVFRLAAFAVLSFIFIDVLKLKKGVGAFLMVAVSALAFSLYHYLGNEAFQGRTFIFRMAAGFYFGAVYLFRGFGITVGSHAAYDVIATLLR